MAEAAAATTSAARPGSRSSSRTAAAAATRFKPAGATGTVGPDLDNLEQEAKQANRGALEAFIQESIVYAERLHRSPASPTLMPHIFGDADPAGQAQRSSCSIWRSERAANDDRRHTAHEVHDPHAAPPAPTGSTASPRPAGCASLWMTPLFFGFGLGLVAGAPALARRLAPDLEGARRSSPSSSSRRRSASSSGIGGFDYWAYYASGRPTRPEDHSGHGAKSWRDYFRINTDHKVIGIQYVVTTIFFFCVGGLLAMLFRAELAQPGDQYFNPQTFNVLVSDHAALMIFLFVIPAFAGLGNYVIPLMIGAADMAFPRLNALSFWLLPIAGHDADRRHGRRRAAARRPAGRATRRSARTSRSGRCSSTWASSGRARARS